MKWTTGSCTEDERKEKVKMQLRKTANNRANVATGKKYRVDKEGQKAVGKV
jgi:hypothetical protein